MTAARVAAAVVAAGFAAAGVLGAAAIVRFGQIDEPCTIIGGQTVTRTTVSTFPETEVCP